MMRKIQPCLSFSSNIKRSVRPFRNLTVMSHNKIHLTPLNNYFGLTYKSGFAFSNDSDVEVEANKLIVPYRGFLTIRNS